MSSAFLHIKFAVDSVSRTLDVDTRRNIRSPVHDIKYKFRPLDRDAISAYVASTEISPENNLFIKDRSSYLPDNNARIGAVTRYFSTPTITVAKKIFLLTDVFSRPSLDSALKPLFFRHDLPDNISPDTVRVFDQENKEVSKTHWQVVYIPSLNRSYLFNDLESSYDPLTGRYSAYWVSYGRSSGVSIVGSRIALVSNEPAFQLATFDDLNVATGDLYPYAKAYALSLGLEGYTLTVPSPGNLYALREVEEGRIVLLKPTNLDDESLWFMRVSNGSWTKPYTSHMGTFTYTYNLPEFTTQLFQPYEPYKRDIDQACHLASKRLVKVPQTSLYLDEDDLSTYPIDLVVWDKTETQVVYALTNDTSKNGTIFQDALGETYKSSFTDDSVRWNSDNFLSVDLKTGFIHVGIDMRDDYVVKASYYFEEKSLEYTFLDVNPVSNSALANYKVVLYLVPLSSTIGNESGRTGAIHYLLVDELGRIDFCSQDGSDGNPNLKFTLENGNWYFEKYLVNSTTATIPSGATTVTISGNSSLWPERGTLRLYDGATGREYFFPYSSRNTTTHVFTLPLAASFYGVTTTISSFKTVHLASFRDRYTVESQWLGGDVLYGPDGRYTRYLILGEVSSIPNQAIDLLTSIDSRITGGVIAENHREEALANCPEFAWRLPEYSEFGQYFPGKATIVVKLPYSLLKTFGGDWEESQLREVVNRHVASGVHVIIKYYSFL